jgi:hypothetical protein
MAQEKIKSGIYVITAAQAIQSERNGNRFGTDSERGAPNKNLIAGLERYCSDRGAEFDIIRMSGMNNSERDLHPYFAGRDDVHDHYHKKLNSNIELSNMVIPPQNVDPTSGRDRFVQRERTKIVAHSKQRLKAIPASNAQLPKLFVTTGCITHPNYHPLNHRGDAAGRDHMYGAVVVEVIDDKFYNVRIMRGQKNGIFVDMGMKYNGGKKPTKAGVEALVLGDIHVGDHDPKTMIANYEMMDFFKPERVFVHDLFNAHSVNPHEKDNLATRVRMFEEGRLDLEQELKDCRDEICRLGKAMGKREVNIVASNHPFFVDRYLEEGDFMKDPWNARIASQLVQAVMDDKDPVEVGIRMMGKLPSNVNFLKLGEDYKVWGWQLASHGHKGISGARGSVNSRELGHGKSITGHTHSPIILRDTLIVGTSTDLDLDYTKGQGSAWMAANAVVYDGGLVQLLPIIEGKWKMKD